MKNVLVIGGGSIGERHLRCFLQTGRARVSLCEIRDEIRERIARDYDVFAVCKSLEEALQNQFDAAVVCTPAHLHIPMSQQLADRGIHLLIEKPLSVTEEGVKELMATLDERNLTASVAYVYRAHPILIAMKQAIESGRYGRPVQLVMHGGQHFPLYRPAYREIYYTRHETGGGAIQDALTHMLNAAEWLVGPVTRLVADADHCVLEGVSVEDTVHVLTRHDQVLGSFSLNQHQAPNESTLTVVCERGTVRFEAHNACWQSCVEPGASWEVQAEITLERDDLFVNQANAFLDCLDGGSPPACSVDEALQTLRVNRAALESVRSGEWVTI